MPSWVLLTPRVLETKVKGAIRASINLTVMDRDPSCSYYSHQHVGWVGIGFFSGGRVKEVTIARPNRIDLDLSVELLAEIWAEMVRIPNSLGGIIEPLAQGERRWIALAN